MTEQRPAWTATTLLMVATAWLASVLLAGWFVVVLYRGADLAKSDAAAARTEVLELQRSAQCRAVASSTAQAALIDYVVAVSQGGDVSAALKQVEAARVLAAQVASEEACQE